LLPEPQKDLLLLGNPLMSYKVKYLIIFNCSILVIVRSLENHLKHSSSLAQCAFKYLNICFVSKSRDPRCVASGMVNPLCEPNVEAFFGFFKTLRFKLLLRILIVWFKIIFQNVSVLQDSKDKRSLGKTSIKRWKVRCIFKVNIGRGTWDNAVEFNSLSDLVQGTVLSNLTRHWTWYMGQRCRI